MDGSKQDQDNSKHPIKGHLQVQQIHNKNI